ncbi:MAG TPA: endonuclease/exonuclease/phosphatase family protein [Planctomycetaceae bacterium]
MFVAGAATIGIGSGALAACLSRPDALAALTLIPAWCWPLAGVTATIPAWRIRGRRMACAISVLWIAFAIGWAEDFSSAARSVGAIFNSKPALRSTTLRIVSLNCDSNASCLADLQRTNPDIVLLQEAPGVPVLTDIARQLYGDTGRFLSGGDTAILARGVIQQQFADRSAHFVSGKILLEGGPSVQCICLRLAPPPSRLDFWNGGFWSEHRDLRNVHRRQLRQIMNHIESLAASQPLIVGGDFNATGLDTALDELRPTLADAFVRHGTGWGATGTNDWPLFRVDQVWTDSRLRPIRVYARKTKSSDHRLVICDAIVRE